MTSSTLFIISTLGFYYLLFLNTEVTGLKCFVCIPSTKKKDHGVINLLKEFSGEKIRRCEEFHEDIRDDYIKECPSESVGCVSQFQGRTGSSSTFSDDDDQTPVNILENSMMRSCARLAIDDCKEVNNVTYCYCTKDECNTPEPMLLDPYSSSHDFEDFSSSFDDEDSYDSSGDSASSTELYEDSIDFITNPPPSSNVEDEYVFVEEKTNDISSNSDIDFSVEIDEVDERTENKVLDKKHPKDTGKTQSSSARGNPEYWCVFVLLLISSQSRAYLL